MTLKFMDGFETSRTDSDLRLRNYLYTTGYPAALVPASTGLPGYSIAGIAAGNNSNFEQFSGSPSTLGIWTGVTVNQAYLAGGFSMGFSATANLNSVTNKYYGYAMGGLNTASMIFDGTNYWAFGVSAANNMFLSPDLKNWTPVASLPAGVPLNSSSGNQATLTYLGSGVVAYTTANQPTLVYYTSNSGASWSTATIPSTSGVGIGLTNNVTYPHVIAGGNYGTSRTLQVGTIGGTLSQVFNVADSGGYSVTCRPKVFGNICMVPINDLGSVIYFYTADVTQATALNTAAAWTSSNATMASGAGSGVSDFTYNPVSNLYVFVGAGGVYTIPNPGAAGTPAALPSGAVTATSRYSTVAMQGIRWDGTQLIAWGQQGHIITSPDGINWTEQATKILPIGTSGTNYQAMYYLNSTYIVCTDTTSGLVCTTSDGINNYQVMYANHKTSFAAITNNSCTAGFALSNLTTIPANPVSSSVFTQANGSTVIGYVVGPVTSGGGLTVYGVQNVYNVSATTVFTSVVAASGVNTPVLATHYYEIVMTAVAGTANKFNVAMYIDGSLTYSGTGLQVTATSDTTTSIVLCPLPANQGIAQVDDIYFCLNDGTGVSGPQGTVNIVAQRPSTDVSAVWSRAGSAASNAASVRNTAPSSQTANYVYSQTAGDKDVYSTSDTLPAGFTPKAVQTEAYMGRLSVTTPQVKVGIISSGTEADSAQTSVPNPAFVTQIQQTDPNGNVAWTPASVNAAQFALTHVV